MRTRARKSGAFPGAARPLLRFSSASGMNGIHDVCRQRMRFGDKLDLISSPAVALWAASPGQAVHEQADCCSFVHRDDGRRKRPTPTSSKLPMYAAGLDGRLPPQLCPAGAVRSAAPLIEIGVVFQGRELTANPVGVDPSRSFANFNRVVPITEPQRSTRGRDETFHPMRAYPRWMKTRTACE